jgi:hypothetical protein
MKKKIILALVLAAAGSSFLFCDGTPSILAPHPAVPAANEKAKEKPVPAKSAALQVKGEILKVHPADKAKGTAEWIVVLSGKKRVRITVGAGSTIEDAKGTKIKPSALKAGETVCVSYRHKGKSNTALTIRT